MMTKVTLFLFSLCFFPSVCFYGQSGGSFDYHFARGLVLEHQFTRAEAHIGQWGENTPHTIYLEALSSFLQHHLDEHHYDGSALSGQTSIWLSHLEGLQDADALFTRAVVLFFSSFTHGRYGNYMASVRDFNRAYRTAGRLRSHYPRYAPGQMMHGVILVLFGSMPENYKWLLRLMNIPGDVDKGLEILHKVYKDNRNDPSYRFHEEHLFFLVFSYRNFSPEPENLRQMEQYYQHPRVKQWLVRSPMIRYSKVMLLKDLGENDRAISWMERPYRVHPQVSFLYLDAYVYGMSLLQKMDYAGAKAAFNSYLDRYSGDLYVKASRQKLAWIALLTSGKGAYQKEIRQVEGRGSLITGADKWAQQEMESGKPPNRILLKARLLFDGGYYQQALKELLRHNPSQAYSSTKDGLEYRYRLGRIYDKLEEHQKAIANYAITIKQGGEEPWYYAANAALMTGEIHLRRGEKELARKAFEKCLEIHPESYKESIHQKAKARLKSL